MFKTLSIGMAAALATFGLAGAAEAQPGYRSAGYYGAPPMPAITSRRRTAIRGRATAVIAATAMTAITPAAAMPAVAITAGATAATRATAAR